MALSSGVATVLDMTSALAPVYLAVTVTDGGTMSGNCVIGSEFSAISPRHVMSTEIAADSIGRLMNILNMASYLSVSVSAPAVPVSVSFSCPLPSSASTGFIFMPSLSLWMPEKAISVPGLKFSAT